MMNTKLWRRIALAVVLVMLLACFAGCKSPDSEESATAGDIVVDMNDVAGNEIEIDIPDKDQGTADNTDNTDNGTTNPDNGTTDNTDNGTTVPDNSATDNTDNGTTDNTDNGTTDDTDNGTTDNTDNGTVDNTDNTDDGGEDEEPEVQKPAYDESKELVVVSYNIKCAWYGTTFDQIVDQIKAVDADIVGFQEVDCYTSRSKNIDQIATIAAKAGYPYYYFEPVIELGKNSEKYSEDVKTNLYGHAVMSKYPITKSEIIWPDSQNKNGGEPRNFGRHEIDVDGTTVVFYNGHLDGTVGREQYFQLQEEWMNKDEYAICVGDFNETYSEYSVYFDFDKYYCFSFGEEGESIVLRGSGENKSQVIDHIIVTKDKFVWKNGGERDNGYYVTPHSGASDHDMVYCYLNIIK